MDNKIIEDLFKKISSHFDVVPDEAKKFFSMFIEETLAYRDELAAKGEEPLTVADVQKALSLLEEFLTIKKVPSKEITPRVNTLLHRWIARLHT